MATAMKRRGDLDYAPPRNDAYIVLLIISLVAMILGCALLWLDYSSYPDTQAPKTVTVRPANLSGGGGAPQGQPPAGAPGAAAPGQPGVPPAGAPKQ